jgi:hypothetical protein
VNAIGDRSAYEKVDNFVCEVIVPHQSKGVIWPWRKFKKLPIAAEHQKKAVDVSNSNVRIQLEIVAS